MVVGFIPIVVTYTKESIARKRTICWKRSINSTRNTYKVMESYSESKKQKETGENISVKIKKYKEKNDTIPDKMLRKLNGNAETRVRAESQRT